MIPGRLAALSVVATLALGACATVPTDEAISTPPPFADLAAVPADGAKGTGLQFVDGATALSTVAIASSESDWFSVEVAFTQRYTPTEEVPAIFLANYTASAKGTADELNAILTIDGDEVRLFLRDGLLLGYGDAGALADLGFPAADRVPACLSAEHDAAQNVLALVVPNLIINTLLANPANPIGSVHTGVLTDVGDGEQPVLEFGIASGGAIIGTLWVSAEGEPYPRRIVMADPTGEFSAQFDDWNDVGDLDQPDDGPEAC